MLFAFQINHTRSHSFLFPDSPPWVIWTTEVYENSIVSIRDVTPGVWHGGHDVALGRLFRFFSFIFFYECFLSEFFRALRAEKIYESP